MDFEKYFSGQQKILSMELEIARSRLQHYGERGSAVESAFRSFLEQHLPRSNFVGTGEVISKIGDTSSRVSNQLDVIVCDESQPLRFDRDLPATYLIEGVKAAGEIKTSLHAARLENELKKGANFCSLQSLHTNTMLTPGDRENSKSYYTYHRPYFLWSFENNNKIEHYIYQIMKFINDKYQIPLGMAFLIDKNFACLIWPSNPIPWYPNSGLPFYYYLPDNDGNQILNIGTITFFKSKLLISLFIFWISAIQNNAFLGQSAIGSYLQDVMSNSLEDFSFAESKIDVDSINKYQTTVSSELENLNTDHNPKNSQHPAFEFIFRKVCNSIGA